MKTKDKVLIKACGRKVPDKCLADIETIARQAWRLDRFHAEKSLDQRGADRLIVENIRRVATDGDHAVFIARSGGKTAGFIIIGRDTRLSTLFGLKYGVINYVGTHPGFQGRGLGTRLVREALRWFQKHRFEKIDVSTDAVNIPAIRVYEKCGFSTAYFSIVLTANLPVSGALSRPHS